MILLICDPDIWMNGVVISSIGVTFFLTAFIMNATMRLGSEDSSFSFNFNFLKGNGFKNDELSSSLPESLVVDRRVDFGKPSVWDF